MSVIFYLLSLSGNTKWDETKSEYFVGRNPIAIKDLMNCTECKLANLMESEAISLRLYTGPAFMSLNGSLRQGLYLKGKRTCLPVIVGMDDIFDNQDGIITLEDIIQRLETSGGMAVVEKERLVVQGWTSHEIQSLITSTRLKNYFEKLSEISRKQFYHFQMMEGGCGKQDYGACKEEQCAKCTQKDFFGCPNKVQSCPKCTAGADCFSTTIAVINSAILKLSLVTPLPAGSLLYRGIDGMSFPDHLLDHTVDLPYEFETNGFKDCCRGFVEFGVHDP